MTTSDSSQLQQVFLNILNNAIDAIGKNGTVSLKTAYQPDNQQIVIKISDTGPGMSREFIETQLFQPFATTKKKGIGLGMYQVARELERLEGRIEVTSGDEGGTSVRIEVGRVDSVGHTGAMPPAGADE